MSKRHHHIENIYSSAVIQALEQEYCSSCSSAVVSSCLVSSQGLGARMVSRIYHGGRQTVYTATLAAMLANNMALPAYGATITVASGVTSSNLTADNGTTIDVYGSAISTTLNSGGDMWVSSGGKASDTVVNSRGGQHVVSGGVVSNTTVNAGGELEVYSRAKAYNVIQNSGGHIWADVKPYAGTYIDGINERGENFSLSNGVASNFIINDGRQYISYGGSAIDTTINRFGEQIVLSGGNAHRTIIYSGGLQTISSGGTSYQIVQNSGGRIDVEVRSGGIDINTKVTGTNERGEAFSLSKGVASNFIINSGGRQYIYAGGVAIDTTINSAGQQKIYARGSSLNVVQNSGGGIETEFGGNDKTYITGINENGESFSLSSGVASNFILNPGGWQTLSSGGVASHTIINASAWQIINSGASSYDIIQNPGGTIRVGVSGGDTATYVNGINESGEIFSLSSGVASNFILNSEQTIYDGGVALNTIINSGGTQTISSGGKSYNIVQKSGGLMETYVIGSDAETHVDGINPYGENFLLSNGVADNFILGWKQHVSSGGVANNTIIDGGYQYIYSGGLANHTTDNAGYQYISTGGMASDTILNSGSLQHIAGGIAKDTILNSGARQYLDSGAKSYDIIQNSGGEITVSVIGGDTETYLNGINERGENFYLSNGVASNFILNNYDWGEYEFLTGGIQSIGAGGVAHYTIVNLGGKQEIKEGGLASNTTINSGGSQLISSGGVADTTWLNGGGFQSVYAGGSANSTIIALGGIQEVADGGIVTSNIVDSGGGEIVSSGGLTHDVVVNSGGSQVVLFSGSALDTVVNSYGSQIISSGGWAGGTIINANGSQMVSSGGVASDTTINLDGWQMVKDGGIASDTTINSGTQWVFSGGVANNTVVNSGYQLVSGGVANNTTINSGGWQDVSDEGVANNTTINSGGTQNVSSGGIANSTIINSNGKQYVFDGGLASNTTINSGGDQHLSSGGVASHTTIYYDADQIISAGGLAKDTIVYEYGFQNVSSGGVASDTIVSSGGYQEIYAGGTAYNTTISANGLQNISSGGRAQDTQIKGGTQNIFADGTANHTTLTDGTVNLYAGGTVNGLAATGGALNVYGNNTLQGNISLANANVNIKHTSGMNTLTMANLSANDATFNMNVDLEEQTADKLSITDNYTGNANLKLTNVADGAKETTGDGIKLVEFGNNATVDGSFDLVGGQWDEGGYVYKLEQGTQVGVGRDYYLRSTGILTDTFKTMLNIPVMNAMIAQTGMNSLQKRMGDLRGMNNPNAKQGVWVRSYYKDMTVKDLAKTDMNLFGAEAGYDWLFRADEPTKLYAGVLVGFVAANNIKTENNRGMYDKGDGEAPGVGVYATLVNENGWFVDIAARNFWSKLDMKNHTSGGTELAYKPKRNVLAASVEVGKSITRELARDKFLRIEPTVEVGYMNAASASADVSNTSNKIKYDATNYINAKAGVLLSYNAVRSNGLLIEPLLELAYRYEFDGKGNVSYGGAKAESDLKGGTAEINVGLNMQLTDNLYWYGLGSYEASDKVKGWGVHAGIRYAFGGEKKAKKITPRKPQRKTSQYKKKNATQSYKNVVKPKKKKRIRPTKLVAQPTEKKTMQTTSPVTKDYSLLEQVERRWRESK